MNEDNKEVEGNVTKLKQVNQHTLANDELEWYIRPYNKQGTNIIKHMKQKE